MGGFGGGNSDAVTFKYFLFWVQKYLIGEFFSVKHNFAKIGLFSVEMFFHSYFFYFIRKLNRISFQKLKHTLPLVLNLNENSIR